MPEVSEIPESTAKNSQDAQLRSLLDDLISGDEERAETCVQELVKMEEDALPQLLSLLYSSDPNHRWWATRALACLKQPAALDGLRRSLDDPDASVRQCAALGLRLRPTAMAIPGLIQALGDSDRLVARLAGDALVAVGPAAVAPLSDATRSIHPGVRIEATRSLAQIVNPQAVPALIAALNDSSYLVQYWAEDGLNRLGIGMLFFKL
ncbi:MAG: hypothetical protein GTO14_25305 [Anaerolineales bacterium]|nr:hypothetical protein [Anaerolineales bacterium]